MPSLFSTRRAESPAPGSRITRERRASRRESSTSVDTVDFQGRLRNLLGEGGSKNLFRKRSSDLLRASSPSGTSARSMSRGSTHTAVFSETDMEASDAETDEAVATPPGGAGQTTTRIKIPLSQDPEEAMAAAFVMGPGSLAPFLEPEAPARASTDEHNDTTKERVDEPAPAVRPAYAASIISQDGRRPSTATTASFTSASDSLPRHPSKASLVLQSAPMPLPIANLPTLTPVSTQPPEWGTLAREGGPKSPALSRANSRSSLHGVFPFFTPVVASPTTSRPTPSRELTDKEIRKATRAMPVMTRMPTQRGNDDDEDDGGEAEDDDDDADASSSQESPPLPAQEDDHLAFTTKGKAPAAGTMTPVAEEAPGSSTPSSLADRQHTQALAAVEQIRAAAASSNLVLGSTSAKSVWNLATPRPDYSASAGEWATFTESPLKTATIAAANARAPGYFDSFVASSGRTPTESAVEATPRASDLLRPVTTPRKRSGSGQVRPARSDPALRSSPVEEEDSESSSSDVTSDDEASGSGSGSSTAAHSSSAATATTPATSTSTRPSFYTRPSQSMVNLSRPQAASARPESSVGDEEEEAADASVTSSPPESVIYTPPTPNAPLRGQSAPPPLKRRLSLEDVPPPKYQPMAFYDGPVPKPREEEGRERLPPYWCGVHIEGTLARKMEFNAPGVQAKDRSWKKHYFVLHGTALYVYKFDPTKVPLRSGEVYLTASNDEVESHLHVHLPPDRVLQERRASMSTTSPTTTASAARAASPAGRRNASIDSSLSRSMQARRLTNGSTTHPRESESGPDAKDLHLFTHKSRRQSSGAESVASSTASAPIAAHLPFAHNQLVHVYSLHNAESGLAADYKKRLHCVRVRSEGQQFMLQTESARQCVQWIEAFQAATNVAMDLDVRPMPVQQTLPRRRRRRNPAAAAAAAAAAGVNGGRVPEPDTPEGNAALVAAAERRDRDRDRMLAEDQAAHHANTAIMS
ncbi:hypothetical protein Q8F55_008935 [Vanrija albida]|uniref:PH domain-containing protein n=1 Tax=Vanrija albida TaxID=181172 RepID=A0ABR3PS93_9TREE